MNILRCLAVLSSLALTPLWLAAAPIITTQPQPVTISHRANAILKVVASGTGTLSYQWYQGVSGDTSHAVPGATSALLVSLPLTSSTYFWVQVTDTSGSTNSIAADVTVSPPLTYGLWTTGLNTYGQLGNNTTTSCNTPRQVAGNTARVSAGNNHTLFIKADGSLWAMGYNEFGQLGDGTSIDRSNPVCVATDVAAVAAGGNHTLFIKADGTLMAMGCNESGQLGNGSTTKRLAPVQVATGVVAVSAGYYHSLFIKADGTLWGMGDSSSGQIKGWGCHTIPVQLADGVASVSAGNNHTLFVKTDGTLWAMGYNWYGQLGNGTWNSLASPIQVATEVVSVSGGGNHTMFIKADGTLMAMGCNESGQLGNGSTSLSRTPIQVADNAAAVSAGRDHTLFIMTDGTFMAMGANSSGQLGDGTTTDRLSPVQVVGGAWFASSGMSHSAFLKPSAPFITAQPAAETYIPDGQTTTLSVSAEGAGTLSYQWYAGPSGNTANPIAGATSSSYTIPPLFAPGSNWLWVRISGSSGTTNSTTAKVFVITAPVITTGPAPASVTSGSNAVLSVTAGGGGLTYQWYQGTTGDTSLPVPGATGALLVSQVLHQPTSFWVRAINVAGTADSVTAAVTVVNPPGSGLWSMGGNACGQLGDGTTATRNTPVHVAALVATAATGSSMGESGTLNAGHTLFVKTNGSLWGMGDNRYGQLGMGSTRTYVKPVQVADGVACVSSGDMHTMFLKTDGTLWGTGYNGSGELCDNTMTNHNTPVPVASGVALVSAGSHHTMFVKTDGSLWTSRGGGDMMPVQVSSGVAHVSAGDEHNMFVKTDGTLWAMGSNDYGQLGDGSTSMRTTPVQVASGVAAVAAGRRHTMFVKVDGSLWGMGYNSSGQLGDGTTRNRCMPVQVATGIASVSAGGDNTRFIKTDGTLWQTGGSAPSQIETDVESVSTGAVHTVFVKPSAPFIATQPAAETYIPNGQTTTVSVSAEGAGTLSYQWYAGSSGNTANPIAGATSSSYTIPPLFAPRSNWLWVLITNSTGATNSTTARVYVVLPPEITSQPAPTTTVAGANAYMSVTATGGGLSFQWYEGATGDTSKPVPGATGSLLVTLPLSQQGCFWARICNAAGTIDTQAATVTIVSPDSSGLWTVGYNCYGQLGNGSTTTCTSPVQVAADVLSVAARSHSTLFVKTDHTLWGMGNNGSGQLGDGTKINRSTPVLITSDVAFATAGEDHTLFVKSDRTLWGMGANSMGQLGNSTRIDRSTPIPIASSVISTAAGGYHSLFVTADGTLWGMGYNHYGELGDGTTTGCYYTPIQVASGVAAVFAGHDHSMFIKTDGSLWGMGSNYDGALGTGISSTSPKLVATGVVSISTCETHTIIMKADGTLWAAGNNGYSQFGDGTPSGVCWVPVPLTTDFVSAAVGWYHSAFLKPSPPFITGRPPAETYLLRGQQATLNVTVEGTGILAYQWYQGLHGDTTSPIPGATSSNYATPPLAASSVYWMRITNSLGTTDSNTFAITVIPRPWFPDGILLNNQEGGRPSLLWRNLIDGEASLWLMNGKNVTAAGTIYNGDMTWDVEHVADFNGDGQDDLLWRNTSTGSYFMWLMNGLGCTGSCSINPPRQNEGVWRILACGDYNGDGCADLLWRDSVNGEVIICAMNGMTRIQTQYILPAGSGWTPLPSIIDLNGDGTNDILWTLDGGSDVAAWLMGPDITVIDGGTIYDYGPSYSLVVDALGDFNDDGATDLFWRNTTTGDTSIWLMSGLTVTGAATVFTGDTNWMPLVAADFDGDNREDILWRNNTTGDYAVYRMGCTAGSVSVTSSTVIYHYTTEWTVVQIADFDGDGTADLVWRNADTGAVVLWLMNGNTVKDAGPLYP